jgi:hypothetical protein
VLERTAARLSHCVANNFPLVGDTFVRIVVILLFALAGAVSAAGMEDRSTFARLAYTRSPDFLTTRDAASTRGSQRPRAESISTPGLRVLTVAAARHLAGCAATLHSTERATSVQRAQLLAARFIPGAKLALRDETGHASQLKTLPSVELAARKRTVEGVEPATPPERAAPAPAIEVIGAETPPLAELAAREETLEMVDAATPAPVEITARGETVTVAEAGTHAAAELAPFSQPDTMAREVATPERVTVLPTSAQAAALVASSHQKPARAKSQRKSVPRTAKRHHRVAQRKQAKVRRRKRPIVTATYGETHTDPRRGRIPASAEKMYDINWQNSAFTYD